MDGIGALQDRAAELCDWLETMPRTYAAPVVVKIGRTTYAAACYTQVRDAHESTGAYRSGERNYGHSMMYVLGKLPYQWRRAHYTLFRIPGASFAWYVAGWYDQTPPNEHHPFGSMFQMGLDKSRDTHDVMGQAFRFAPMHLIG